MSILNPNRLVQDTEDGWESEQRGWFADYRHFQDMRIGSLGMLVAPVPSERTGRLLNQDTLRYLASKDLLTTRIEEDDE